MDTEVIPDLAMKPQAGKWFYNRISLFIVCGKGFIEDFESYRRQQYTEIRRAKPILE